MGIFRAFPSMGKPPVSMYGIVTVLTVVGMIVGSGCTPMTVPGNGDGNGMEPGRPITAQMNTPASNFSVSVLDTQPIAVLYTVTGTPDTIVGYFIPVTGQGQDSEPVGDPIVVATGLTAGTNRSFSFVPSQAGVGFFRMGVRVVAGDTELRRESNGVIEVQGHPDPRFIEPAESITEVEPGDVVQIVFDAGDPQNLVQWRLFFMAATDSRVAPPDVRGTQLGEVGFGNIGEFLWEIEDLPPGNYQLGLAATDSGFSVAETVARGLADRIIIIPNMDDSTPIVRVLAP